MSEISGRKNFPEIYEGLGATHDRVMLFVTVYEKFSNTKLMELALMLMDNSMVVWLKGSACH